jgi:hypothetical protein
MPLNASNSRFRWGEISPARLALAALRRVTDIPDGLAWQISPAAKENRSRLKQFQNRHTGKRCVVIANGPSLAKLDLTLLKNEITFGMNRIYLHFPNMGFEPTYYVAINELVISQFNHDIAALKMPKFLNWNQRNQMPPKARDVGYVKIALVLHDEFGVDISKPISSGGTVTYVALQLAYYMGFTEVVLIGLDHRFASTGTPNLFERRKNTVDESHFHPNYFPPGVRWQFPDLYRSELAYATARQAYEAEGRKIIDATLDGACTVFEKVTYSTLFK